MRASHVLSSARAVCMGGLWPEPGVSRKVLFGAFVYDQTSGELRKHGTRVRLNGQPLRILTTFVRRPGETITREEFQHALWQGSTFVDFEHGLNAAVNRLRQVLGDSADQPRYIETLPGRGYRFIAPLESGAPETLPPPQAPHQPAVDEPVLGIAVTPPSSPRSLPLTRLGTISGALLILVAVGIWGTHWVKQREELYRLQMQGDFYVSKWTEAEIRKGIDYYNRAILLDPSDASSYAGLATGWTFLSDLHSPPHEAMPRAKAAALNAVRLNNSLVFAHINLGVVKMQYDWDWAGAEQEFKRAIVLDPTEAAGHRLYGWLLIAQARFQEAQREMKRPLESDPLDAFNLMELGLAYYFAGQYENCIEQCRRSIGVDATSYWPHMLLGWAYEQQGHFEGSLDELVQASRQSDNSQVMASLGHAYAIAGRRAQAESVIAELQQSSRRKYVSPYDIAAVYAGLGDREQTLVWLEKAYQDRSGWLAYWGKVDPRFTAIRTDPRFQNLLRSVGLAP
jgi:DNA-binding winged helix-turn-helix (wHTH) protein/tetratricopeptide (TPR) repeat protein